MPAGARHAATGPTTLAAPAGARHATLGARAMSGPGTAVPVAPDVTQEPTDVTALAPDRPWQVVVWNDPVNLMSYVTFVFQKLFGYSRAKATRLMLDVHHKGRAVVSSGPRERAELDAFRLHEHGLWATLEQVG